MPADAFGCTCPMSVRETGQHSITCRATWDCKAPTLIECPLGLSVLYRAMAVRGDGERCKTCSWRGSP